MRSLTSFGLAVALACGVGFGSMAASQVAAQERSVERVAADVTITGKVKSALMADKQVAARDINVDTVNGVVHLKGKVGSKAAAQRAVALAQKVGGVKGVKSHLQVAQAAAGKDQPQKSASKATPPGGERDPLAGTKSDIQHAMKGRSAGGVVSDVTITGKVKTALSANKNVSAHEINVDTLKGIVYLKGTVDSKAEAQKAVAIAQEVAGVKGVKNMLKVAPDEKVAGYKTKTGSK